MGTVGAQRQQLVGSGELLAGDAAKPALVTYRLEVSTEGTVTGIITAPPLERLTVVAGGTDNMPLLRIPGNRLIAFQVRVYEPRPGGSAQILGSLLPQTVNRESPAAA